MQIAKTIPMTFGRRLLPTGPMKRLSHFTAADRPGSQAAALREVAR